MTFTKNLITNYSFDLSCFFFCLKTYKYKLSTFVLAQSVFRKNFKDDLMLGLSVKHLILICSPSFSKPA